MNSSESEGYYRFTRNCELPIRWMSPEAVQFGVFSILSDIWSYGIVLYEIITFGVFPYDGLGDVEVVERVKRKDFSIIEFLPVAARDTIISRLIYQCCQHQWQHRPASLDHIIAILRKNPECVRPFLTDEPPKPNSTIDALRFQPGAGACIMSKNTLASGDPSPSNPVISNPTSDSTHGYPFTTGIRGVLSATGSLGGGGGIGKSLLDHHHHRSTDSFSENISTSVFLSFLSDPPLQNFGRRSHHRRRRHKTADDGCSTRISRYHDIRRGTSCSSSSSSSAYGHTFRSSEQQSFGDHRPTTIEDQPLHPTGGVSGGGGGGGRGDSVSFPMWRKSKTAEEKEKSSRLRNLLFNKQTSVEHGDDNDDDDEHVELIVSKKTTTEYSDPIHAVLNDSYTTVRQLTGDLLKNKSHIENRHEDKNLPLGSRSLSAEHMLLVDYIQKNEKPVHAKSAPDNASSSSAFTAYISQSTSKSAYILLDTDKQFTSVHNYDCQPYQDTLPNGLRVDILRENNYSNSSCKTEVVTRNACHLHTHHNTPSIFRSVLLIFSRSRRKNNSYPPDNLRITKSSVVCQPISSDSIHHTCVTSHLFSTSCPSIFTSPHFPVFNCNASDNTKNNNTNKCSIPSVSYLTTSSSTSERHQQQHQLHHRYPVKNEANRKKTGDCHAPNFVNPVSDTKTTIDCESFNSEQPVSSHHHHLSCIPPTVTSDESVRKSNHSYFV
uniref:SH2 domain-containing protein n=1 Tax=Trichobilharzia regenti TaxID=157069 RepID=A0AA85JJC6_TRIRE|nr:unnamed protein product [Trichobilharzia regenti]